jgi:transcription-repair coupling factor (superfamily II helicase)
MQFFADILNKSNEFRSVSSSVDAMRLPIACTGLSGVHKAHIIYSLCVLKNKKSLIIAPDEQEAVKICDDLTTFFREGVYFLPTRDFTLRPVESVSREYEHERLRILGCVAEGKYNAVVTCADALMQFTIPKSEYVSRTIRLRQAGEISVKSVLLALVAAGYTRSDKIEGIGQFAVRGGILDFFPPHLQNPVRVEFWGETIDTISLFEIETQRRTKRLEEAEITPAVEVHFPSNEALIEKITDLKARLKGKSVAKISASLDNDIERLNSGLLPASVDRYLPLCYEKPSTIFDYIQGDTLLFVSEQARVHERAKNTLWQHGEDVSVLLEEGILCKGLDKFYLEWPEVCSLFEKRGAIYLDAFARSTYETPIKDIVQFTAKQLGLWSGGLQMLCEDLKSHVAKGGSAVVMAGTERIVDSLVHDLNKENITAYSLSGTQKATPPPKGSVLVLPGKLSGGFEYPTLSFMLISHGRAAIQIKMKSGKKTKAAGERIRSLSEITPGDYVVHSAHGIGVYEGIHKLEVQGIIKDYIKIRYAGKDTLYVPVTQLDLVSKYIGPREDGNLRLSKMGGSEWQKAKSRVRAAVKDMAKELIQLYAARKQVKGHAFPEDNEWQKDFEQRFEFTETDDQLRCIEEIKSDMEQPFPMERLLCGDVGFGKTEVALRAAFKCVMDGKQCAILVPTTILAWQHYQTIFKRIEGFPIKIELLSRFRSAKQQDEIISKLARGDIDIVVGTHRIVQKDMRFRDLGLVIIDEEQRFGVAQKEKLKETYNAVDVLTLSATPIPRTLNMAMSGIRDMSTIDEAPQDRHPVQTYVLEHDMGIIADAIKKELRRGGQVYYLHNRVETIDSAAMKIKALVPEARIGIGHGKVNEEDLSLVWEQLLNHEIDVLVCTTIIETGVDVPNCNTLIIEDADRMGLSQLHQIRGRVGRSSRRAFAYFTFKRGKVLSEIATKRLSAIREFTEFGSGFQIALRDLEIRGAGNILGSQQHGHMDSVGYDMYLKLLNEAVLEEKGEAPQQSYECMIDIQVSAHIPERFIENSAQRLEIYRHIADIRSEEDASDVIDELIDRFGEPPQAVKSLVDVALIRNTSAILGIKEISQRENVIMLFPQNIDLKAVSGLVTKLRGRVMVNAGQKPYVSIKLKLNQSPIECIREVLAIMWGERQEVRN